MDEIGEYFDNIVSRTWLGQKKGSKSKLIERSEIQEVYMDYRACQKSGQRLLVGKSEAFYFLLECHDSDGYKYANLMVNEELAALLKGYTQKKVLGIEEDGDIEAFVSRMLLNHQLRQELPVNQGTAKRRKI